MAPLQEEVDYIQVVASAPEPEECVGPAEAVVVGAAFCDPFTCRESLHRLKAAYILFSVALNEYEVVGFKQRNRRQLCSLGCSFCSCSSSPLRWDVFDACPVAVHRRVAEIN